MTEMCSRTASDGGSTPAQASLPSGEALSGPVKLRHVDWAVNDIQRIAEALEGVEIELFRLRRAIEERFPLR
jgi:hypothetical protein